MHRRYKWFLSRVTPIENVFFTYTWERFHFLPTRFFYWMLYINYVVVLRVGKRNFTKKKKFILQFRNRKRDREK